MVAVIDEYLFELGLYVPDESLGVGGRHYFVLLTVDHDDGDGETDVLCEVDEEGVVLLPYLACQDAIEGGFDVVGSSVGQEGGQGEAASCLLLHYISKVLEGRIQYNCLHHLLSTLPRRILANFT